MYCTIIPATLMPLSDISHLPVNPESPAETSASEGTSTSEHQNAKPIDPATSQLRGSITYDRENGYDLEWESIDEFHQWHENEQRAHGTELRLVHTASSCGSALYTASQLWVCPRQGTGGEKDYQRKTNQKSRKERKRLDGGCPCQVKIKVYAHTPTILGRYTPDHSHLTGKDNLKHVRIRVPTQEHITELIRLGLMDKEIVHDNYLFLKFNLTLHARKNVCMLNIVSTSRTITHT